MKFFAAALGFLPAGWDEVLSWLGGGAFTFALFLAMSGIEPPHAPAPEIEELHQVSLPFDTPPPPPRPEQPPVEQSEPMPLVGLDTEATESPVRIHALPPDFEALLPHAPLPPRQLSTIAQVHSDLKPKADPEADSRHIYQQSEVDRVPKSIVRVAPNVPTELFGRTKKLQVVVLLLIDRTGQVESVRVTRPSGRPVFDSAVLETVRKSWKFSPAIRRGKPVRCLAEQGVTVMLPGSSPFEAQ